MGFARTVKVWLVYLVHLFALLSIGSFFLMLLMGNYGLAPFYLVLPAIVYGRYIWRGYQARQRQPKPQ